MRLVGRYNYVEERRSRKWKDSMLKESAMWDWNHLDGGAWRRGRYSFGSLGPLLAPPSFPISTPWLWTPCYQITSFYYSHLQTMVRGTKWEVFKESSVRFQLDSKGRREKKHWEKSCGIWMILLISSRKQWKGFRHWEGVRDNVKPRDVVVVGGWGSGKGLLGMPNILQW